MAETPEHDWQGAPRSFATFYRTSKYAKFPQEHRVGRTLPIRMLAVRQQSHDFVDPPVPEVVVSAARKTQMAFRWDIGDGWTRQTRVVDGSLHLLPAETEARIETNGAHDMLFLSIPAADMKALLDPVNADLETLYRGNTDYWFEPALVQLLERLWALSGSADPFHRLEGEGLMLQFTARLLGRASRPVSLSTQRLSDREIDRTIAFMSDMNGSKVSIRSLADLLGMSRFQFARSFKNATGKTPQAYYQELRLHKAKALVAESTAPLAEIAAACGYASQSHMTDVFRARLNTTPGRLRVQARS